MPWRDTLTRFPMYDAIHQVRVETFFVNHVEWLHHPLLEVTCVVFGLSMPCSPVQCCAILCCVVLCHVVVWVAAELSSYRIRNPAEFEVQFVTLRNPAAASRTKLTPNSVRIRTPASSQRRPNPACSRVRVQTALEIMPKSKRRLE